MIRRQPVFFVTQCPLRSSNIVYNMRMHTSRFLLVVFLVALCLALTQCGHDWCIGGIGPCEKPPYFDPEKTSGGGTSGFSLLANPQQVTVGTGGTNHTSTLTISGGTTPYTCTIPSNDTSNSLGTISCSGSTGTYTAPTTMPTSTSITVKVTDSSNPVKAVQSTITLVN